MRKVAKNSCEVLVLVPIFKEESSLDDLLPKFEKIKGNLLFLFIITKTGPGDNSEIKISNYQKKDKRIFYITNQVRGLGRSYLQGFQYALSHFNFDYLVTMDGDGSHNSAYINYLRDNALRVDADLVIASRYIDKGSVKDWNLIRARGSRLVTFIYRKVLAFPIYDSTSGFRLYSHRIIEKINFDSFWAKGFVFQMEALFKVIEKGGIIYETAYNFQGRVKGKSKFRMADALEYLLLSAKLILCGLKEKFFVLIKKLNFYLNLSFKLVFNKLRIGQPRFYRLTLKANNDCNLRCSTCGNWRTKRKDYLPIAKARKAFAEAGKDLLFLTITGGEPFINPKHLFSLISEAKKHCPNLYYLSINTNGFLFKEVNQLVNKLLQRHNFLKLYLGLNYFPEEKWTFERTNNKLAFKHSQICLKALKELQLVFPKRLAVYKMLTISRLSDAGFLKKDKDLWMVFAEKSSFYNNQDIAFEHLDKGDKIKILDLFYRMNKKTLGYLEKRFLKRQRKMLIQGNRPIKCWAGLNRYYLNEKGRKSICIRGLQSRPSMGTRTCSNCWTPCEANFDIIQNLY